MEKKNALPTQELVEIESIKEDVVFLKTGGLRKILLVSGINIELKSEEEQNLIYSEFQNFLNSLDFSLQLVIHSRKLNIEKYLNFLEERERKETDDLLKNEVAEYREFVKGFVADNDIMTKNFFVIVPFEPSFSSKKQTRALLPSLFSKKENKAETRTLTEDEAKSSAQLNQRTEHVISGLHGVGLRAVPLNTEEMIELFFNLYNPETTEKEGVVLPSSSLQT